MTSSADSVADATPLARVPAGQRVRIVALHGGRGLRARLAAMGFRPSVEIEVVRSAFPGPIIVTILNGRVMLGRGMAQQILVTCGRDPAAHESSD